MTSQDEQHHPSTGNAQLDEIIQGLRWGDNVVLQVERLGDYAQLARAFVQHTLQDGGSPVYVRFAPHPALFAPQPGLEIVSVDPGSGFDLFSAQITRLIEERGPRVSYVFDNLSALVEPWATDELLANFFRVTCPYLHELDTVAYFGLTLGSHSNDIVARVADTTQVLIDLYHVGGHMYVHPIKAAGRYSPRMFMPHLADGPHWRPIFQAATLSSDDKDSRPTQPRHVAPWDSVYARLSDARLTTGKAATSSSEVVALKTELRRMLMGDEPSFACLADRYLTVDDLLYIRERMIGSGRIGGKAAGMLLARRILLAESEDAGIGLHHVLEDHDSFYIGSDVFFTFLVNNGLFRRRLEVHRRADLTREHYKQLERDFLQGEFPPAIIDAFRAMLNYYGQNPIIVRSSSFLEDGFGHAFAGKYRSEFCANQGSLDARLVSLLAAIKRVYASALSPDALAYRRRHGLVESDEQMAILVQRVSGVRNGRYYYPQVAGVAFSRNIYPWTERIDPSQGLVRLVFGLGTRAVDRVEDYPRMIALSHPELRPESGSQVARYSQRLVDLLDLEANAFRSLPLVQVLEESGSPDLSLYVSEMRDGFPYDPPANLLLATAPHLVLTFNNLIRRTNLVPMLRTMLARLEAAYGQPIDMEFTARIVDRRVRVNLLQCRPMSLPGDTGAQPLPSELPSQDVLFRARRMAGGGLVRDIRYIIYIDPRAYEACEDPELRLGVARVVGRLNNHTDLHAARVMMMGPGRWGSSNPSLGVRVSYADIDHTSVLVEIAREESGQMPEVSFGTHFFQDLVEDHIIYLPVYPNDPFTAFDQTFFSQAPNSLGDVLPDAARYETLLKLIDVPTASNGRLAQVIADPNRREAVCFLE